MSDVTVSDVKDRMKEYVAEDKLLPFLTDAEIIVEQNLSGVYSDEITNVIITYLTAHLASLVVFRNATRKENLGGNATYTSPKGSGYSSTFYGQMLLTFDTKGILANLGKGKAFMRSLNYDKTECLD